MVDDKKKYYDLNGYVIFDKIINEEKIDYLLKCLEDFKKAKNKYYSQSLSKWIKPSLDDHGFLIESMENFTRLAFSSGLAQKGNDIVLSGEILNLLRKIKPEFSEFSLWQNMLFDRSTGTPVHQDSWYLDTQPKGNLIAIWIALEDIDEKCGPFKVYPKSHKLISANELDNLTGKEFLAVCDKYSKKIEEKKIIIKKGSVLFWHPSTLHGSNFQIDEKFSRKSLTAHYYPLGAVRQYKNSKFSLKNHIKDLSGTRKIKDLPIHVGYSRFDSLIWNIKGFLT